MKTLKKSVGIIAIVICFSMIFSQSVFAGSPAVEGGTVPKVTLTQEQSVSPRQACYACGTGTLSYHHVKTEYDWRSGVRYTRDVYKYVCYSCGFSTPNSYTSWVIG